MESADLHHQHHLQQQFVGSSLTIPSYSTTGVGTNHAWNANIILEGGNFNLNGNEVLTNPRELRQRNESTLVLPSLNTSMIQDLGFHWDSNAGTFTNHSAHEHHLAKIKEEFSDSFPKFTEMMNNPSNAEDFHLPSTSCAKHEPNGLQLHDLNENIFLKSFSSGCQLHGMQFSAGELYPTAQNSASFNGSSLTSNRGGFSRIFPSTNISNLNPSSSTSMKFGESFSHQHPHNNMGLFRDSLSFGLDHMQESSHRPSSSPTKMSSSPLITNGVAETKRSSNFLDSNMSQAPPNKKPRSDQSRSSCPPFKVRKEKLGDRIAALQHLVAPFGKTDTASVLMEAIGYIKFLQDQIETLSVPYMNSTRSNTGRTMRGVSEEETSDEARRDLRSSGLCLVPLSCTSYVTNDSGGIWPPP